MVLLPSVSSCVRKTSLCLNINESISHYLIPFRCFFNRNKKRESMTTDEYRETLPKIAGMDDPNFTRYLARAFTDIDLQKHMYKNLWSECKRFYNEECRGKVSNFGNIRVDADKSAIQILYKFETPEDLEKFRLYVDSTDDLGYSSASLNLTENETAIFSGNICTDPPKTGNIRMAGYASLIGPKQHRAFKRFKPYDWTDYSHLVFKIRGDGRSYLVILNTDQFYKELSHIQFCFPLYTRGGPYWQIAKMPFSYFFYQRKGKFQTEKYGDIPLSKITHLGITAAGYDGPFKLEIDYIGLEFKPQQKSVSPYEEYRQPN